MPNDLKPSLKYWIFILGLVAAIFGVIIASVVGSWLNLSAGEQSFVIGLADKILPFPLLGAFILVAIIGGMVSLLFRYYIIPILRLAESTQLISLANPGHRIETNGAREVKHLAGIINSSADAYQKLQMDVDTTIRSARADLMEERNRFAALMSELPGGVLACNIDGQILLYNKQVQKLLQSPSGQQVLQEGEGGWIGLGRSVFGIFPRESIVHGLKLLQQSAGSGEAVPTTSFMMSLACGRCLRVTMAPVFGFRCQEHEECLQCERRMMTGFVLALEDMTMHIESETHRDLVMQTLTDELQSDLEELKDASDQLLADPAVTPEHIALYRRSIDLALASIQQQLLSAREEYARHLQMLGKQDDVLGEHLVEVIRRNIAEQLDLHITTSSDSGVWLKLDSYALVQAVSHLAVLLKSHASLGNIKISLQSLGGEAAVLEVAWSGSVVSSTDISEWREMPLISDPLGNILSIEALLSRDGGSLTVVECADGGCVAVQLRFSTIPSLVRTELTSPQGPRPVYYEFDLFNQGSVGAIGLQPLRKLTFVVFDTETTGLNPAQGDEIIQIGAVRIVSGRILHDEAIDLLIDPKRPVPDESVAIHGITSAMVTGQPTIDKVLPLFHRFAEGAVLVAHNAAFDMRCLQLKQAQTGVSFDQPVLDTLLLSSIVHPYQETHALDGIARRLNLTIVGRHTALGDAIVTAEVLLKLIPLLESRGIVTLDDALNASKNSPFAKIAY